MTTMIRRFKFGGLVILLVLAGCRQATELAFHTDVDAAATKALTAAVANYNNQSLKYQVSLVPKDAPVIDLSLGQTETTSLAWRSLSWRLWSRLQTLSAVETKLQRSIIRFLRDGSLRPEQFISLLTDIQTAGFRPLALPLNPPEYAKALEQYTLVLTGEAALDHWISLGLVVEFPNLQTAVQAVLNEKAVFILGDDQGSSWFGRSIDNNPEAYSLPGIPAAGSGWVIGRLEGFKIAPKPQSRPAAIDFLNFLTSKTQAESFAKLLPGNFYHWTDTAAKNHYPTIKGPANFFDPTR